MWNVTAILVTRSREPYTISHTLKLVPHATSQVYAYYGRSTICGGGECVQTQRHFQGRPSSRSHLLTEKHSKNTRAVYL